MERIKALRLIEKNRISVNNEVENSNKKINDELKENIKDMSCRLIDIIETARLCEAGELHCLKMKRFKLSRIPGIRFTDDLSSLSYRTTLDNRIAVLRVEKDGNFSFFFSGTVSSDPQPNISQQNKIMMEFFQRYDKFERKFYKYVDKRLLRESSYIAYLNNKHKEF